MTEPRCVGSGFCCKRAVCPFGTWDAEAEQCASLVPWDGDDLTDTDTDGAVTRYRCAKHDEIVQHPLANFSPAFGAGCCQPLFNVERDRIVRALNQRSQHLEPTPEATTPRTRAAESLPTKGSR